MRTTRPILTAAGAKFECISTGHNVTRDSTLSGLQHLRSPLRNLETSQLSPHIKWEVDDRPAVLPQGISPVSDMDSICINDMLPAEKREQTKDMLTMTQSTKTDAEDSRELHRDTDEFVGTDIATQTSEFTTSVGYEASLAPALEGDCCSSGDRDKIFVQSAGPEYYS